MKFSYFFVCNVFFPAECILADTEVVPYFFVMVGVSCSIQAKIIKVKEHMLF